MARKKDPPDQRYEATKYSGPLYARGEVSIDKPPRSAWTTTCEALEVAWVPKKELWRECRGYGTFLRDEIVVCYRHATSEELVTVKPKEVPGE